MGWTGRASAPDGSQSAQGACQEKECRHASHDHHSRSDRHWNRYGQEHASHIDFDSCGAIVLRENVTRRRMALKLANLPPCLIGIEAGLATHYVARELAALGHDVKQVPPTYAKPFRRRVVTVPGIGPIISNAMVAAIGNGAAFARGRDFSAWDGLVPSRGRPETEPSSGVSPSVATVTYARSSCNQLGSFCCGRRAGRSTASESGLLALLSACIPMVCLQLSPTC
jgi:Transposase IS116/IS110/IS902 family